MAAASQAYAARLELGSDFMTDTGNRSPRPPVFAQPNEVAEGITRLVVTEGRVGSGRAARIGSFSRGPRVGDMRRLEIEWTDPRV